MKQTQKVEEYESPRLKFFLARTKRPLCSSFSGVVPEYEGFGGEENL